MDLPEYNKNPATVALMVVVISVGLYIGGIATGYWFRVMQEDSSNLAIVASDELAEKDHELKKNEALNEVFNNGEVLNSFEEDTECSKCLSVDPLPESWYVIMQPSGSNEVE